MTKLRTYKCFNGEWDDVIKNVTLITCSTHHQFLSESGELVAIWPLTSIIEDVENYKNASDEKSTNGKMEIEVDEL